MKPDSIRITIEVPTALHKKLREQAAAEGRSIPELILAGAKMTLVHGRRSKTCRVRFPLIKSDGPPVELGNEQIYEETEFP